MSDTDIGTTRSTSHTFTSTAGPKGEYLTRNQAANFIRDVLGRPMSFSTASKLAALGEFAPVAIWWGRRPLYTRDDLRAWAEARTRPGVLQPKART